jgi:ribosome-associated toxin RatA of RatAB toxin-antitoxin module
MPAYSRSRSGGRRGARRHFGQMAIVMALLAMPCPAAAEETTPKVIVSEEQGIYSVTACFQVPQSASVALEVLTDYEHIPRFMPGVKTSVVLERSAGRALVAQEAVSRLLLFSKRVHLTLEVTEGPGALQFRDRSGRSFSRYEGAWTLSENRGETTIKYELVAQPSFDVPEFILKRLLSRDSAEMIDGLRAEIAARAQRLTVTLMNERIP